jgi:hypothetical protein
MTISDTIARDAVATANADAMCAVLAETGYPIPARAYAAWRPTERVLGTIPGMPCRVTCVATDGNLGLFIPDAASAHLGSAFLGHVHRFEHGDGGVGCPATLHKLMGSTSSEAVSKKPRVRQLSKRQQILNSL